MKIRWENDGVQFEAVVTDEHINLTCDAVAEGCWIPNEDWPKIRDYIDKELGVVHSLADKAQQNIEAILNGEEWAAAQRSLED
jgi:hypothetical protein